MTADHLIGIERFEADLWKVADNLRANSNLASNEYFMRILGLIFLRHATNRYYAAMSAIEADKAAGKMPDRPLVEADFTRRRALMLPDAARYDVLLEMPKDGNLGAAVTAAMEAVEDHFPPLAGQLPKDYERFEDDVLEEMMRTFDAEALRTASGDVFGRIYEYFLAEFSKQGAHDNGEFFTPPSIVQTIVNVIEPDHGVVLDPACGSGGMFVQSSHFIEDAGEDTMKRVTFYGHEKNETTAKLAGRMIDVAVKELDARSSELWANSDINKARRGLESARVDAAEALRKTRCFVRQADWLQERFPEARLRDVEGLVKLVDRAEIEAHDWSLTPGRYVGVAPEEEDEGFDFQETLRSIHFDLQELNEETKKLAARIARNFEELGV